MSTTTSTTASTSRRNSPTTSSSTTTTSSTTTPHTTSTPSTTTPSVIVTSTVQVTSSAVSGSALASGIGNSTVLSLTSSARSSAASSSAGAKGTLGGAVSFTFLTSTLHLGSSSSAAAAQQTDLQAFTTHKSLLQQPGPTAGIFLVVGLVTAVAVYCAYVAVHRRLRNERRHRLRYSIGSPRLPDDDDNDDDGLFTPTRSPPVMRQNGPNRENIAWGTKRNSLASSNEGGATPVSQQSQRPLIDLSEKSAGFAGVGAGLAVLRQRDGDRASPFSDFHAVDFLPPRPGISRDEVARGPSRASLPSMYTSVHEDDSDVDSLYEKEIGSSGQNSPAAPATHFSVPLPNSPPPALQPKSPLRALQQRKLAAESWEPPSPPSSISSSVSSATNPIFDVMAGPSHRYPTLLKQASHMRQTSRDTVNRPSADD